MKQTIKRLLVFLLCLLLQPFRGLGVPAADSSPEPPAYLRELSRLVAETASEDDFGEIKLTVGEPEMEIDGRTQPIADDGIVVPYVDENGVLQIPTEVIEEADAVGGYVSEDALEEQGYAVDFCAQTGKARITEPYGLCRLIVRTANGKVKNTCGATRKIAVSDNCTVLQYTDKEATARAAKLLRADPSVLACTADRIVKIDARPSPNDAVIVGQTREPRCWGTQRAGADAWMAEHAGDDLAEVVVAVIDTGVDASHPFLQGRMLSSGWDFVNDDNDPADDNRHGTHCAGIIRDATPDNVKILPVKVLSDEGKGDNAVAREAMRWAVDQGADILSMSFGAYPDEEDDEEDIEEWLREETAAIQYAYDAGVTCVAAAGNEADDLDVTPHTPAVVPHVITVGSIGEQDLPSGYTNFGSMVDVCAPGEGIVSSVPGGQYEMLSGTSMACPLAAAVCANFLSTDKTQTPDDVLDCLTLHAEDVGLPGRDDYCGAGCVSMRAFTPVSGMTLPYETLRLQNRADVTLRPVFSPSDASTRTATFTSSDPAVAMVDGYGNVFTKKKGDAVITAVSTDGGFSASCAIHVFGSSGIREIFARTDNTYLLCTDGTVQYTGLVQKQLGSQTSFYPDGWGYVRDPERMPLTGITKFWELPCISRTGSALNDPFVLSNEFYTKEDGILRMICADGTSAAQEKADGQLLTGITDIQSVRITKGQTAPYTTFFALDETGAVYTQCTVGQGIGRTVWAPVRKEDGSVLTNVRRIGGHAAFCKDGSVWFMTTHPPKYGINDGKYTLAVPYTCVSDAVDGFILAQIDQSSKEVSVLSAVLVRADGSVWAHGNNAFNFLGLPEVLNADEPTQVTFADGSPLADVCAVHFNGFGVFALRTDGTVLAWGANRLQCVQSDNFLGTGEPLTDAPSYPKPVVVEDGSLLSGVRALLPGYGGKMLFLREDSSVWVTGFVKTKLVGITGKETRLYHAVPYRIGDEPVVLLDIPMEPYDPVVPARSISISAEQLTVAVGESVRLEASVLPANADNPYVCYSIYTGANCGAVSSSGVVTGYAEGTMIVRACAAEAPMDVYAECVVTVTASVKPVLTLGSGAELRDGFLFGLPAGVTADGLADYLAVENGSLAADSTVGTGTIVRVLDQNGEVAAEYTIVIEGDVNGDGLVNSSDMTELRAFAAGLQQIESGGAAFFAADVNGDDLVNSSDLTFLRKQVAGIA